VRRTAPVGDRLTDLCAGQASCWPGWTGLVIGFLL
jgi:hypothetical protein